MSTPPLSSTHLALAQGAFYVATGLWPILHFDSFMAVTGPKTDLWLVQTVGALLAAFGLVLAFASWRRRLTPEWRLLATGFPLVLATIDIVFVARDVISPIYLANAAGEILLAATWAWVSTREVQGPSTSYCASFTAH